MRRGLSLQRKASLSNFFGDELARLVSTAANNEITEEEELAQERIIQLGVFRCSPEQTCLMLEMAVPLYSHPVYRRWSWCCVGAVLVLVLMYHAKG